MKSHIISPALAHKAFHNNSIHLHLARAKVNSSTATQIYAKMKNIRKPNWSVKKCGWGYGGSEEVWWRENDCALTLPPTYAFPVIVANPKRSSKLTRLISMISWSPGVTGDFHLKSAENIQGSQWDKLQDGTSSHFENISKNASTSQYCETAVIWQDMNYVLYPHIEIITSATKHYYQIVVTTFRRNRSTFSVILLWNYGLPFYCKYTLLVRHINPFIKINYRLPDTVNTSEEK